MNELREFRKANHLTQLQLGEYLGIGKSFVSSIETGKASIPDEKFTKLLQNDQGWDTSMLAGKKIRVSGNSNAVNNGRDQNIGHVNEQLTAAILNFQNLLAKKDEQIDRLITIIERK